MILKLDFHKAFDCVSWSFLDWILSQMRFPQKWRLWISSCVTSVAASILVNGSPTIPIKLHRGLRQGDPLSPFLFVLVVEFLNLLIKKATNLQMWNGVPVSKNEPLLTHLQYADDTVLFSQPNLHHLMEIKKTLILFQLISGLQINFHKPEIMGVNVSEGWIQEAARSLYCKAGKSPLTYLGLLIGDKNSRIKLWDPILDKMEKKLASWKQNLLLIEGRLTLIKASLASLPIYYMSLLPIPKGVVDKIVKLQRRFLWAGSLEKRALPLVCWDTIQLPKRKGGLNVSNLLLRNLGLLFKWIWRFFEEPNSFWRQIIQTKYNYPSTITLPNLSKISKGGPCKEICNFILSHPEANSLMKSCS